jgi:hypothetical protein
MIRKDEMKITTAFYTLAIVCSSLSNYRAWPNNWD